MPAPKPKTAQPVHANAGVQAWYRGELQKLVREMAQGLRNEVVAAWQGRGTVAHDAEPVRAAGVMLGIPDGRVLFLRRTDGQGWAFPGGGVDPGEDVRNAAHRELGEEIGVAPWPGALQPLDARITNGVHFTTYTHTATHEFKPVLNDEHDAHTWATIDEALTWTDLHPGVHATLATLARRKVRTLAQDAKPPSIDLLRRALDKWGGLWTRRLETLSEKLAHDFANKNRTVTDAALRKSFRDAGLTIQFKPTKAMLEGQAAVIHENVHLIKSIPQKMLGQVQSDVWRTVTSGSDLAALKEKLQRTYNVTHNRAALIARDQNNKAKAVYENARRQELGITQAIWVHSHGGVEPRRTHLQMDGKTYDIAKGMWDRDEGEFVHPGQLINCRCVSRPVLGIKGFE
jgi:8-oxo-dGTP pyrophosphatase MutT (NUDIX family)